MKNFLIVAMFVCAACLTTACRAVRDVNISETLQVPATTQLYLAANLWYTDAQNIDARNLHQGNFIRVGTPIAILQSTNVQLKFKTISDDKEYTVVYDESWMMLPVEDFVRRYLSTLSPKEQFAKVNPRFAEAIRNGKIEKGMSREEVLMSWGYPVTARTPKLDNNTWIYLYEPFRSSRVIFVEQKVSDHIDLM